MYSSHLKDRQHAQAFWYLQFKNRYSYVVKAKSKQYHNKALTHSCLAGTKNVGKAILAECLLGDADVKKIVDGVVSTGLQLLGNLLPPLQVYAAIVEAARRQ